MLRFTFTVFLAVMLLPAVAHADHVTELETIDVAASRAERDDRITISADTLADPAADTAAILKRFPGANVNSNGPLTGIAQYRGMFGDRINVLIDGSSLVSGGPNAMDTPLSYMPRSRLESIEIYRGTAPVSSGIETLGGTISASSRLSRFGNGEEFRIHGDAGGGVHSVDNGYSMTGLVSMANHGHRLHAATAREYGNDRDFPGGTVRASRYERDVYDLGYGFRTGVHEFSLDYRRNETGPSGTAALPMDIEFIDTDIFRGGYQAKLGTVGLEARLSYNDVAHRMSNFTLRDPVNPLMRRYTLAEANGGSYSLQADLPLAAGNLVVGTEGKLANHDADIFDPDNAMFLVRNFNDVSRDLYSIFSEWAGPLAKHLRLQFGARYTRVNMDAGVVDGTPAQIMPAAGMLRDGFNDADRSRSDDNVDLATRLNFDLNDDLSLLAGAARKTRSPSYQERYLWLPLQSAAGLADGNNYVGDINLSPEVAYEAEFGFDWRPGRLYFAPRVFYRHVDDYIQGTPATDPAVIMVSTMTGDPTPLRFSNVDAQFYGFDAEWGAQLAERWFLDGIVTYVRGERRDIDDDLYRIAPLNTTLALTHRRTRWSWTLEGQLYAGQEHVSATNGETASGGYGLLNFYGRYSIPEQGVTISAGFDNLLDKQYRSHLAGTNRVINSDVAPGLRLPGDGINGYLRLALHW